MAKSRRHVGHGAHTLGVDSLGGERVQQAAAEVVVADAADHAHVGAEPAAATAWLAPLPPGVKRAAEPSTVLPGPGSLGTVTEMSMFRLPRTVIRGRIATPER